ncbi:synaptotagmin-like protein 3 isoform X2 [Lampris incognitus]|uniref:synaptotagmin-like protein 3 isoform X2 n=1 Tax=Lampris incognitus TaxID=2546036 RepID=UPI0024B4D8F2|nr:synaptotagmin-like protein 3 isoform X2 [Lampris incognitus]
MDLSLLQALERENILEVLRRDKLLRTLDEERIRRMKFELQEIRRKGAKSFAKQYGERTCARCQRPLGRLWNSGDVCRGCSHRICSKCRVAATGVDWKCTVCHAYREVKIRSGEWFLEERAKKFPPNTERQGPVGEKLLKSYQMLSHIAVVPPTPPPYFDCPPLSRSGDLKNSKTFAKSMEDLMVSFTSHMKKISKSQSDVRGDQAFLRVDDRESYRISSCQKSLSDTDLNKANHLSKVSSLTNLFRRSKESDQEGSSTGAEEEVSLGSEYSGGRRGSSSSASTDCGFFESNGTTGELEMALAYNPTTSCLEVTVAACRNIAYGDAKRKKCHPYVRVYLLPEKTQSSKLKTSVKRNTTNPVYNEVLQHPIERPQLGGRTLQASVWHSGTLKRKVFLGEVRVSLESWRFDEKASQGPAWYPLCPKQETPEGGAVEQQDRGDVMLQLRFSPFAPTCSSASYQGTDKLTVLIKGAKRLAVKANSRQNAYVRGCLTLPGGRALGQTTAAQLVTPNCGWPHQLVFDGVSSSELRRGSLTLEVWERSSAGLSDRPLGGARVNPGSPWKPVLQMPNKWHDLRLPLVANVNTGTMTTASSRTPGDATSLHGHETQHFSTLRSAPTTGLSLGSSTPSRSLTRL